MPQFRINRNGPVEAYYKFGGIKLRTSGLGVTVYGQLDTTDLNVSGVSTIGSVSIGGSIVTAGIVTATHIFADRYHGDQNNNFYAGPHAGSGSVGIASGANTNIAIGQSVGNNLTSGSVSYTHLRCRRM